MPRKRLRRCGAGPVLSGRSWGRGRSARRGLGLEAGPSAFWICPLTVAACLAAALWPASGGAAPVEKRPGAVGPAAQAKLKVVRFGGLVGMPSPKRPNPPAARL